MGSKQMLFSISSAELVEIARETRRFLKKYPIGERTFEEWIQFTVTDVKKRDRMIVARDVLDNLNSRRNITQIRRITVWRSRRPSERMGEIEVEFFDFHRRFRR